MSNLERQQLRRADPHRSAPARPADDGPQRSLGRSSLRDGAGARRRQSRRPGNDCHRLEGANNLGRDQLKRAAQVLAETPDGKPLLLSQEVGGRVMAFAADSTWRWWMGGHEAEHKRFWRQADPVAGPQGSADRRERLDSPGPTALCAGRPGRVRRRRRVAARRGRWPTPNFRPKWFCPTAPGARSA